MYPSLPVSELKIVTFVLYLSWNLTGLSVPAVGLTLTLSAAIYPIRTLLSGSAEPISVATPFASVLYFLPSNIKFPITSAPSGPIKYLSEPNEMNWFL